MRIVQILVPIALLSGGSGPADAAERWYNYYADGLRLAKEQKYAQAIVAFEQALEGVYQDQGKKIQTYGMHFIDYHPHREIGIAAHHLGDVARAREELDLALAYTPNDDRAKEFFAMVTEGAPPPTRAPTASDPAEPELSITDLQGIQRALSYKGYYSGAIDGIFGGGSTAALKAFQQDNRLPPTGELDEKTRSKIRKIKIPKDFGALPEPGAKKPPAVTPTTTPPPSQSQPAGPAPRRPYGKVQRVVPYLSVGVIPMTAAKGAEDLGGLVAERMVTSLVEYQRFQVNERVQMDKVLKELKFGLTDLVDPATAARLGKQAGVDCLVMGSVSRAGATVDMDLRLVDTETGEVMAARSGQCPDSNPTQLRQAVSDIAAYFANILPLIEGSVVKVDPDGAIYVGLGSKQGMRKGMKLHVFTEGDPIVHPVTGASLGRTRRSKSQVVLTEVMEMYSVARPVEGEEAAVAVNDLVVTK
ncbi:MAG: peptidoglycan-binding protein [Candidatus Eisenbacteria bacterium]|jgi:peptidoglycan hydrolase-like protein with peptidoglycan-binding domain|nr:peptidoglycan-binding protein [Candidatus Eisenbacteria bacterium]